MKLRLQVEQARFGQSLFQLRRLQFELRRLQLSILRLAVVIPGKPAARDQPVDQIIPLKRAAQRLFEIRKSEHRVARVSGRKSAAKERIRQDANEKKRGCDQKA